MDTQGDENIKISAGMDLQTLEKLAHLFGLCLYTLNLKTKYIDLNVNTTKITGHDLDSLPTSDDTKGSMIYDEDHELIDRNINSILSGEKDHYHMEYRMRRRDSSIVWIEEVGLISGRDADGQPLYMAAMASDLSRLRWAEQKAQNIERDLKRLAASHADNALAEENRLLRAANAAAAMIIGGYHQDYEVVLHQAIQMLCESLQADYVGIWRNMERDGSLCCFLRAHWSKEARAVGDERSSMYIRYDDILPDWRERLTDHHFVFLGGDGLPEKFMDAGAIPKASDITLAPFYLHGDFWGMIGFSRSNNIAFNDYEIEPIMTGAIIIASSISRNETFGKIRMDRAKAIADTMAKSEFLSRMSHELRTPLNAIIGMTHIALREKDLSKMTEYIKKVEGSSQLLLSVINDVLDMSKIEAGKLKYIIEPFDFCEMLQKAENIVMVKMDEKKQSFTVYCDEAINRYVICDEHRLLQVVVNLLNNATKFTHECGTISLTAFQRKISDDRIKLHVEVRDNGAGMTLEQQGKLFTAFEQADGSITRKYGGTGLGLAICKKILNALGGDIWVSSKLDHGSCFLFELEVDLGDKLADKFPDPGAQMDTAPAGGENEIPDLTGRSVLLAEDIEINREIIEIMLADTGVKLICVENGKDAVESFSSKADQIDLILMDVQMPIMDGISATKRIRSSGAPKAKQVPIIAMTANAFNEDISACIDAGMNGHIAKPFAIESLYDVLRGYLT